MISCFFEAEECLREKNLHSSCVCILQNKLHELIPLDCVTEKYALAVDIHIPLCWGRIAHPHLHVVHLVSTPHSGRVASGVATASTMHHKINFCR